MSHIGRYDAHFIRLGLCEYEVESMYEVLDPDEDFEIDSKRGFSFILLKYLKDSK